MKGRLHDRWRLLSLCCSLLLLGGLLACSADQPAAEAPVIMIGVIAPITGNLENIGRDTVNAAEMAVAAVNDQGGLQLATGRQRVELVIEDNEDNVEITVSAARKLINRDQVVAIVGPQASRNAIPAATLAEQSRVPLISPWSTNPDTTVGKQYVFRVGFIDPFQGDVIARFAYEELALERAAVLYDVASAYNRGLAEVFERRFEQLGGEIVAAETYTTGERDFRTQLAAIAASEADVLFLPNYQHEILLQVEQARELGINAHLLGGDTWAAIAVEDRPRVHGAFFSTHYASDVDTPQVEAFVRAFQARYQTTPIDPGALTYDAFGLLFTAIESQGEASPEAIREGLSTLRNYRGVTGTISYRGSGDPIKSAVIMRVRDNAFVYYRMVNPAE